MINLICLFRRHQIVHLKVGEITTEMSRASENYLATHKLVIPAHVEWFCERCGKELNCAAREPKVRIRF